MNLTTKIGRQEMDVNRAAKMLMCSRMTVLRYLEDGTLEGYQLKQPRGWWRVYLDSVEKLINQRKNGDVNGR